MNTSLHHPEVVALASVMASTRRRHNRLRHGAGRCRCTAADLTRNDASANHIEKPSRNLAALALARHRDPFRQRIAFLRRTILDEAGFLSRTTLQPHESAIRPEW